MDYHPEDIQDVLVYFIVGLPAIIAAVAAFRHQNKQFVEQRKISEQTLHEVKNEHSSNLRDDLDALASAINVGFREVRCDISGLREELRTERIERIEGDRRNK